MFTQIRTITRNTFVESIRQPIFVVILLIAAGILILNPTLSGYTFDDDNKIMIDIGLSAILFFGVVLGAFIASGVMAKEIDNKTVLTVISKPINRPVFVIGKFLGVVGTITLATWIWTLVLLFTVRHQVMETAAATLDMPVISFGIGALVIAIIIALWGNYFYNWVFASTFTSTIAVTLTIAYILILMINKNWSFQPITTEFCKNDFALTQLIMAIALIAQTLWALCAIAVACSTRLAQLMTLLICLTMFLFGGASEYITSQMKTSANALIKSLGHIIYIITPDIQVLFMSDALTQKHHFGLTYLGLTTAYISLFTIAMLALAIALFQTREVG